MNSKLSESLKIISTATVINLFLILPVQAEPTWIPEFKTDQSVYVDPKLQDHPLAPFKFSPELAKKINLISEQGIKYYVVAAQQGDETIPLDTKLGIAKVEDLLPRWNSNLNFNKKNYAVIFWVRRSDNLNKGSVGVNVGELGRDNGVSVFNLNSPEGLVIPALKKHMPSNPEGAMVAIVDNIETQVKTTKEARIAHAKQVAAFNQKINNLKTTLKSMGWKFLNILPFGFSGGLSIFGIKQLLDKRKEFEKNKIIWEKLINNSYEVYLAAENTLLEISETLRGENSSIKRKIDATAKSLVELSSLLTSTETRLDEAKSSARKLRYRTATHLLKAPLEITQEKVAIELLDLTQGVNPKKTIYPQDLNPTLETTWDKAQAKLAELLKINDFYLAAQNSDYIEEEFGLIKNDLTAFWQELNNYNLDLNSTEVIPHPNFKIICPYQSPLTDLSLYFDRCKESLNANNWFKAWEFFQKAEAFKERVGKDFSPSLRYKLSCEKLAKEISTYDLNYLKQLSLNAKEVLEYWQDENTGFPIKENLNDLQKIQNFLNKESAFKLNKAKNEYGNYQFKIADNILTSYLSCIKDCQQQINYFLSTESRIEEEISSLMNTRLYLQSQNRNISTNHRTYFEDLDWNSNSLTYLRNQVEAESQRVSEAKKIDAREKALAKPRARASSSYSSYSSSSNYSSYSGGSDYSSSSSSSSYDSSSGGGDY